MNFIQNWKNILTTDQKINGMKIQVNDADPIEVKNITVIVDDEVEFVINLDKFGKLLVNKQTYGDGERGIVIIPRVSNEITLS